MRVIQAPDDLAVALFYPQHQLFHLARPDNAVAFADDQLQARTTSLFPLSRRDIGSGNGHHRDVVRDGFIISALQQCPVTERVHRHAFDDVQAGFLDEFFQREIGTETH